MYNDSCVLHQYCTIYMLVSSKHLRTREIEILKIFKYRKNDPEMATRLDLAHSSLECTVRRRELKEGCKGMQQRRTTFRPAATSQSAPRALHPATSGVLQGRNAFRQLLFYSFFAFGQIGRADAWCHRRMHGICQSS